MALRKILTEGDEQLLKHSRKVEKFDDRLHTLIDDMRETLENSGGVGLAAPQVGILRRVVVLLDVNKEPEEMVELVNPEVIEQKGSERVVEGCLSVPGVYGYVTRPTWAKIRAQDRNGNWFEREGEGIVAQCFCHETEHLDGHLFTEKVEEYIDPEVVCSPQEAFYAQKKSVPIRESAGAVCSEFVMCYPPGIPILAPGERITGEILDYIEYAKSKGCSMTGPEDPKIEHINILTDGGKPHGIMV